MDKQQILAELENILKDRPWNATINLKKFIERLKKEYVPKDRTPQQNKSLWLYFSMVAKALNQAGLDMKKVLKPTVDIDWSKYTVHDYLWLPIQKALFNTSSTTELKKLEQINPIYDHIHRFLSTTKEGKDWIIVVPFPSDESNKQDYKLNARVGE